jgi:rod shape-determining protein MreC
MKIRHSSRLSLALKPASLLHFFAVSGSILLTMFIMLLHFQQNNLILRIRSAMQDALLPVVNLMNIPAYGLEDFREKLKDVSEIYKESQLLRDENIKLLTWQNTARQLEKENKELRELLGLPKPEGARYVSARVIGSTTQGVQRTLLLQHAKEDVLKKGYIVVTASGMVGRLIDVSEHTATALLITDVQSRIPVKHEPTDTNAIVTGQNSNRLKLKYVKNTSAFKLGDRIVTDDTIASMPVSVTIGYVSEISPTEVQVKPYVRPTKLRFVSIVIPAYSGLQPSEDDVIKIEDDE